MLWSGGTLVPPSTQEENWIQVNPARKSDASKSIYTHMLGNRCTISMYHSQVNLIFLYTQQVMVYTSHLYVFS